MLFIFLNSFCTSVNFHCLCSQISLLICWQFRVIVASVFVKENSWPELVPELASVIQNSSLISGAANCEWNTINALTVLHSLIRPFQVLLIYKCIIQHANWLRTLALIIRKLLFEFRRWWLCFWKLISD